MNSSEIAVNDTDLSVGRQIIRTLINLNSKPPLVKHIYSSFHILHQELTKSLGLRLIKKESYGPEVGYQLYYVRGNVLVRIKTRGEMADKIRGGLPHISVSMLNGNTDEAGSIDTGWDAEVGKFHVGGGLVNKSPNVDSSLYKWDWEHLGGKANADDWSDGTHFNFHDLDLDDTCIDELRPVT